MLSFLRLVRPVRLIKRKGLTAGLFGGNRGWLALGGIVWFFGRIKSIFGFGEPEPVFIEDLKPGQRLVIAHSTATKRKRRR